MWHFRVDTKWANSPYYLWSWSLMWNVVCPASRPPWAHYLTALFLCVHLYGATDTQTHITWRHKYPAAQLAKHPILLNSHSFMEVYCLKGSSRCYIICVFKSDTHPWKQSKTTKQMILCRTSISPKLPWQFYRSWVTWMSSPRYIARTACLWEECVCVIVCMFICLLPHCNLHPFRCQLLPCFSLFPFSCPFLCLCLSFLSTSSRHTRHMTAPSTNSRYKGPQPPMTALQIHNTHTHLSQAYCIRN